MGSLFISLCFFASLFLFPVCLGCRRPRALHLSRSTTPVSHCHGRRGTLGDTLGDTLGGTLGDTLYSEDMFPSLPRLLEEDIQSSTQDEDHQDDYSRFEKTLVILPKFTGMLSILGSSLIIYHILKSPDRRRLVYHRLVMTMSLSDLLSSFAIFISSWPMPAGSAYLAVGNQATCDAHGFVAQAAAIATPSYNTMLSIYYYLVVSNAWTERRVASLEKYFHLWPIALGLSTSIASVFMDLFTPVGVSTNNVRAIPHSVLGW